MKRGQAAMEFLMTYGWAILIVLIIVGALEYLGDLIPERFLPEKCVLSSDSDLSCEEFTSSATDGTVTIRIKNALTESAWVDSISLDTPSCTYSTVDTQIAADSTTDFALSCAGGLSSGNKIKASITIIYGIGTSAGAGLSKTTAGRLVTVVP